MNNKDTCGVYKILCLSNKKYYIGSSKTISRRWYEHKWLLRSGKHYSRYLQMSWNKYGENSFIFSVLEECDHGDRADLELKFISIFSPRFNTMTEPGKGTGTLHRINTTAANRRRAEKIVSCPHNHYYTPENTRILSSGKRQCKECWKIRSRKRWAARTSEQIEKDRLYKREYYLIKKAS